MEIRLMNETEYEASKSLWLKCFEEDDRAFVDWYYSRRTKPENALGAFLRAEAEPAAMLHMLPLDMRFGGGVRRVCFVAGVCTDPDERRKGLCTMLFRHAFSLMRAAGYQACALQPFSTEFYERFGFKTYAHLKKVTVSAERLNHIVRPYEQVPGDPELLFSQYSCFTKGFSGCSVRSADYFGGFIEEYKLKGAVLSTCESGACAGYASGDSLFVTELFGFDRGLKSLIGSIPRGFGKITFPLPVSFNDEELEELLSDDPLFSVSTVPFCMIAPIGKGFSLGSEEMLCFDRY